MSLPSSSVALWVKAAIISLAAIFAPLEGMVIAVFVLVTADAITGIVCSIKRGVGFKSRGLRRTISKLAFYELAIVLAFICESYLTGALLPLSKLAAGAVGLVEILSIFENLNFLTGGKVFQPVLDRLMPRGPPGFTGMKGDPGPPGPQGEVDVIVQSVQTHLQDTARYQDLLENNAKGLLNREQREFIDECLKNKQPINMRKLYDLK